MSSIGTPADQIRRIIEHHDRAFKEAEEQADRANREAERCIDLANEHWGAAKEWRAILAREEAEASKKPSWRRVKR